MTKNKHLVLSTEDRSAHIFVNRDGNAYLFTEKQGKEKSVGRAYALMDLDVSKEQIELEIPKIRYVSETPSELEISVRELRDLMNDENTESDLVNCINENVL
ncbi:hypothetical protein J4474_04085 [Candidatus Pacearchaeota archaeon]|nr:hypothetical protein [Candidatus Pacearchaeota archaeon]